MIGDIWGLRLWSALGVAFFGWAFITSLQAKRGWMRVVQIILLAAALVSVRPLQDWAFGATHTAQTQTHLNFTQIKTVDELNQALVEAKGKPVMLDLYADWCVACKEFEKYTFSDPQVQKALADTVLLQANVTANDAQDVALLKHLNVLGLPTILFLTDKARSIHKHASRALWMLKPSAHICAIANRERHLQWERRRKIACNVKMYWEKP